MSKLIRKAIHKFILAYLKKNGMRVHTGKYNTPNGYYLVAMTDEEYYLVNNAVEQYNDRQTHNRIYGEF